jgi:hypothetical protein
MTEAVQFGIVTGAALVALATLALPRLRRRSKPASSPGAACAKCVGGQTSAASARRPPGRSAGDTLRPR